MTANQLQYWRNVETNRHNLATEQQALLDYGVTQYDVYNNKRLSAESSSRQAGAAERQAATGERNAETNWYTAVNQNYVNRWNAQIAQDRQRVDAAVAETTKLYNTTGASLNQQKQWTEMAQRGKLVADTYLTNERIATEQFTRSWNDYLNASYIALNDAYAAKAIADASYTAARKDYYGAEATQKIISGYINSAVDIAGEVRQWIIPYSGIGQSKSSHSTTSYDYPSVDDWYNKPQGR